MTKLTDTQLVLLSAASQRVDGIIPIGERLRGSVAKAVAQKLIDLGLAQEQRALPFQVSWREDDDGQRVALVITAAGLTAIGIEAGDGPSEPDDAPLNDIAAAPSQTTPPPLSNTPASNVNRASYATDTGRSGTKKAQVVGLLRQEVGASIDDLMSLTGWLPHTTRAALSVLRKGGLQIEMVRQAACVTRYRIVTLAPDQSSALADGVEA